MKISLGFLPRGARWAAFLCVLVGLYSCSPQTSSLDTGSHSATLAHSSADSQAAYTGDSKDSTTPPNAPKSSAPKSAPKSKQKDSIKPPKPKPKDSQKAPATALSTESGAAPQSEGRGDESDEKPKDSQGLKFSYKDLIAQTPEGGDGVEQSVDYHYTGVVRLYHSNGKLAWEISFKDGRQDGWTKWYYDNGQIRTQMFFVNGDANGESLWYYRHGVVRERGRYVNDLADGESQLYTPSGALKYTIVYRNGREISRQEHTPPNSRQKR